MLRALAALPTALLLACGASRPAVPPPPPQDDTTLGAGDVFDIRVYGEEELTGTYRVAQDGTIDFPLVGRIEVAGLEPPLVAETVRRRLQDGEYLVNPQVSLFVKEYNSKRISVIGAVQRPGTFPISSGLTAVQAISLAGGFTSLASRNETVMTRRVEGELRRFRVPAEDITQGEADDVLVQTGDIIYVPERIF